MLSLFMRQKQSTALFQIQTVNQMERKRRSVQMMTEDIDISQLPVHIVNIVSDRMMTCVHANIIRRCLLL